MRDAASLPAGIYVAKALLSCPSLDNLLSLQTREAFFKEKILKKILKKYQISQFG